MMNIRNYYDGALPEQNVTYLRLDECVVDGDGVQLCICGACGEVLCRLLCIHSAGVIHRNGGLGGCSRFKFLQVDDSSKIAIL
jgi:hypothetical protein